MKLITVGVLEFSHRRRSRFRRSQRLLRVGRPVHERATIARAQDNGVRRGRIRVGDEASLWRRQRRTCWPKRENGLRKDVRSPTWCSVRIGYEIYIYNIHIFFLFFIS